MLGSIQRLDNPGTIALHTELRPAHKAYLGAVAERIAFAGPLLEADGATVAGRPLVLDFPSREAALEWLDAAPFTVAGVDGTRTIHAFANL
ncbi:YciI family protein [Burkholderia perseverans]|uniref:YciI family protein n=1 Tax=Burkholderia perseverans TaxID=2615214 RepID=UPI001FEFE5B2|nr:YciI family protein [Burkholderia perseverans]